MLKEEKSHFRLCSENTENSLETTSKMYSNNMYKLYIKIATKKGAKKSEFFFSINAKSLYIIIE